MGIEERLDATISAVDGLHNMLNELGCHLPDRLSCMQKRIHTAKVRLGAVERPRNSEICRAACHCCWPRTSHRDSQRRR